MRTIILLCFCWISACGQKQSPGFANPEVFNSKYVKLLPDTNRMMLIGNAVVAYGDLRVEADSVLYDKPKQTVTIFGMKWGSFKGEGLSGDNIRVIIYRKGDKELSIE